jgi:hypothetical protein
MAHWLEDLTKTMADDKIGRRTAMRRVLGTMSGVALASALPAVSQAKTTVHHCPPYGGDCSRTFTNCAGIANTNCFCFMRLGGKSVCGCNSYCSQMPTCSSSMKCPKNSVCVIQSGCNCGISQGVCLPNCVKKQNRHCQLGSGHGVTAAR